MLSVVTYASETWKMTSRIAKKLDVFQQRCLRIILCVSYWDHITNEILLRGGSRKLHDIVVEQRFSMAGHISRLLEERPAKTAMTWTPSEGRRGRGRPKETWRIKFCKDRSLQKVLLHVSFGRLQADVRYGPWPYLTSAISSSCGHHMGGMCNCYCRPVTLETTRCCPMCQAAREELSLS